MDIQYSGKIISDAYHGTSLENATEIMSNGFKISTGEHQYLGDGVYFFESSLSEAEKWAKKHHSPHYVVIKAVVALGSCLDLVNDDYKIKLRKISKKLMERKKVKKINDAAVINYIAEFGKIDTIRAKFFYSLFPGSHIFNNPYIVICVRNSKNILNTSIERAYS